MARLAITRCFAIDSAVTIASLLNGNDVTDAGICCSVSLTIGFAAGLIGHMLYPTYFWDDQPIRKGLNDRQAIIQ